MTAAHAFRKIRLNLTLGDCGEGLQAKKRQGYSKVKIGLPEG